MDGFKSLLASKTFWGAVVGIIAASLAGAHYTLSADDQKTIVDLIVAAIGAAGNLFSIYGRVVASKKIGAILLALALALGAVLCAGPALAQPKNAPRGNIPGTVLPCDPLKLIPGCRHADGTINQTAGSALDNLKDDLLQKILKDVTYAQALAAATNNKVTKACWDAWVALVTSQAQPVKDAAGNVLERPDPDFFTRAERAAEFINQIQPNSDLNIGCGAALNAAKISVAQMIGSVLVGGALGLFKLP